MVDRTMRELRLHSYNGFPIAAYDWGEVDENGMILECHWHKEWEFFAVYEGQAFITVNGKKYLLNKHDVVFIPGNSIHMAELCENSDCRYRSIVFSLSVLGGLYDDIVYLKYIRPLHENPIHAEVFLLQGELFNNDIYSIFDKLFHVVMERPIFYEMFTKAYLFELLANVMQLVDVAKKTSNTQVLVGATKNIKSAMIHMSGNLQRQMTLAELAAISNMSVGHFGKLFKQMTSCSPIEYLLNLRLSKAAEKLIETDEQVLSIAMDVGFNNIGHFIRTFKKKYSCSPRQYRQSKKHE